jgi:hypothetical protein
MPWEPEHNRNSLSPHGIKKAEGHGARSMHDANCVPGSEMPPGILGAAPLGREKSSPYMPQARKRTESGRARG